MRAALVSVIVVVAGCGDNLVGDRPPELAGAQLVTAEDTAVTYTLAPTDPEGAAVAIQLSTPAHGTVTLADRQLTYTPAADYHGADSIVVTVSDGTLEATATLEITVTPVNDAPVAVADSFAGAEDTVLNLGAGTLLGNDTDVDGDPLTVTSVGSPSNGTVVMIGTDVRFTPAANFTGNAGFAYVVSDGTISVTGTVAIAVALDNDPPVAVDDTRTTAEDTALSITGASLVANDTDPEGQTLTVTAVTSPTNGTVVLAGGDVTFTPAANFFGTATFQYTVSDGADIGLGTVAITVTPVNDAPVAVDDVASTPEDVALAIPAATLVANDTDVDGPALSVTAVGNPTNGTVVLAGGIATFTPAADFAGMASFDYTISDGTLIDLGTVAVMVTPVNDAPIAVDDTRVTPEDTPLVVTSASLVANDTDVDGPALTVTAVGSPINGTVTLVGGTVTFTPTPNVTGIAAFEYTVSDGALTDVGLVTIVVTTSNDPPVAVDDVRTTAEDTPLAIPAASLTANDLELDGQSLTIISVSSAINCSVTLSGGTLTFTPTSNFSGTASFQYTVSDGTLTDIGLVTVTVTPVDDAPVAVDDVRTTAEDTPLAIATATLITNDTDVDGPALAVTAVGSPVNGTVTLAGGTATFTPAANFSGNATFEYTVSDGTLTDVGLVTITVTPVNDPPVALDDTATTAEDVPLVVLTTTLAANDTDVDGPSLAVTAVASPVNGTVTLAGGTATFTPSADFAGTASFDYTLSDGTLTATATVTVTVTPVNDAPVAVGDTATTDEDTSLAIPAATLTANDTDVDGPALTLTAVGNPTNGTVVLAGGTATFTPAPDFAGTATFQYTVSDGTLNDIGLVTIAVTPVNDAPVAVDDTATTDENTPLAIPATTLTANDTDVDGPALSVTSVDNPTNGTVALAGSTVTFTPANNFFGTATFEYTVSDGTLTDTGLVTVTVTLGTVCGDGVIFTSETCDDGAAIGGDGCDASCQTELGYACTGQPSVCATVCGDGTTTAPEQCDDGNLIDDDGCTSTCVTGVPCTPADFPGGDRFAVDPDTGHCYVSFDDDLETFAQAEAACVGVGGYLVTITSGTEDAVVHTVQNPAQNPWIGAVDDANDTDGIFDWVTDETFGFSHFAPGQPDDDVAFGGNGECLHLLNAASEWNDTSCTFSGFVTGRICEVEPVACGDSVPQLFEGEECDDGNTAGGDGCSATCQLEDGCGDGNLDAGEQCDDDNTVSGDGCSATCQRELLSIAITPGTITINKQQRVQLKATGTFFGGTTADVTATASWASTSTGVAVVGTGGTNNGRVDGLTTIGATTISATVGTITGATVVNVNATTCNIRINEVQVRGELTGPNPNADEFAELVNSCTFAVDVSTWNLVYRAFDGVTDITGTTVHLAGVMAPGDFRLYASVGFNGGAIVDGQVGSSITTTGFYAAAGGGLAIRSGPQNTGPIVDAITWGTALAGHAYREGPLPNPPAPGIERSIYRAPFDGADTDNNSVDFLLTNPAATPPTVPTPRATNFP